MGKPGKKRGACVHFRGIRLSHDGGRRVHHRFWTFSRESWQISDLNVLTLVFCARVMFKRSRSAAAGVMSLLALVRVGEAFVPQSRLALAKQLSTASASQARKTVVKVRSTRVATQHRCGGSSGRTNPVSDVVCMYVVILCLSPRRLMTSSAATRARRPSSSPARVPSTSAWPRR